MPQAPSVNLVPVTTMVATPVSSAPKPFSSALPCQPSQRSRYQCLTMPTWQMVKPTKTPIANSGTRLFTSPPEPTSSAAETIDRKSTPCRCTWWSARSANTCGRWLSRASSRSSIGRPPKEVFAASPSRITVANWTT